MSLREYNMSKIRYRFDDKTLMINNEVCAIITGYDKYAVSMNGNVYNIKTKKQLKPGRDNGTRGLKSMPGERQAYFRLMVSLKDENGKSHPIRVHKLVAQEWLVETDLNPDGTPIVGTKCINHINGNTSDNNVFNLEYCDYSYNNKHKVEVSYGTDKA